MIDISILSVGNYHQFISTFQDDFNPSILDNWIAVDDSLAPGKSVQFVLGYEEYIRNIYKIQVEGYYKDLKNLLTYEERRSSTDARYQMKNYRILLLQRMVMLMDSNYLVKKWQEN